MKKINHNGLSHGEGGMESDEGNDGRIGNVGGSSHSGVFESDSEEESEEGQGNSVST